MNHLTALQLVKLRPLMALGGGRADVAVALLDGPVATDHPAFAASHIAEVASGRRGGSAQLGAGAYSHGTFVAGVLAASRGSGAPAICPGCTLLVRPIFGEGGNGGRALIASPEEL